MSLSFSLSGAEDRSERGGDRGPGAEAEGRQRYEPHTDD